jgi:hypothetical protein
MKTRAMMVFLILSVAAPFVAIAHGAETHGKAKHGKSHKSDGSPSATYLDLSKPSAPESDLPMIADKGKL